MKSGRNDPCPCGSGKKYKKCCLNKQPFKNIQKIFSNQSLPEPHLHIVKSVIWKNSRWRVIWNRLFPCPIKESFHEFLLRILTSTFGDKWYQNQIQLPETERHILRRWFNSYNEWKKNTQIDENKINAYSWGAMPTGPVMALHSFAYDIFCLQQVNKLPKFLVKRLKNMAEFQGARYEVAIAAIIARAGFDIVFLDNKIKTQRHCEFIAKNKYFGEEIAVEAKSRHRKGVVHEKGKIDYSSIIKGDVKNLFVDACSQGPNKIPYFIFIDLNVLPTPSTELVSKPWFADIKLIMDEYGEPSAENPDVFSALTFTNFCHYYEGDTNIVSAEDYLQIISLFPKVKIKNSLTINEIRESLHRYYRIPEEI